MFIKNSPLTGMSYSFKINDIFELKWRRFKMTYRELYQSWLDDPYFDEDTKAELKSIEGDEAEILSQS